MSSQDKIDDLRARLDAVEKSARRLRDWVAILGIGLFFALFGDIGWRIWQIDAACDEIIRQNPDLDYAECARRLNEARSHGEGTIRID